MSAKNIPGDKVMRPAYKGNRLFGRVWVSPPTLKINLRLILVSGKTKEFVFSPVDSAGDIAIHVYDNWPEADWASECVSRAEILRLIYQGRFLHSSVTLGALGLPLGRTTVMHLVPREHLPEPNSHGESLMTSLLAILRLIYQGRFLHRSVTLGALGLPLGRTTVMHLVPREHLPEPNSHGECLMTSLPAILRLIYQGRFLHSSVTLGALGLPLGRTTVMHLVPREHLPEPNSHGESLMTSLLAILRLIYQGSFLHRSVTLGALGLPLGRTTVMHLVPREHLPEPNSILRLIYQGRFLHSSVTLGALGRTTVMHLVPREHLPEPNSHGESLMTSLLVILRLIYQGRFLHSSVTLGALGLPLGRTTVMHLVPREHLPEPNSHDQRQKSKGGSSSCCSASCCIL
ncbi:uncharacterized protein LOC135080961 [Ostrinia nubilalis]